VLSWRVADADIEGLPFAPDARLGDAKGMRVMRIDAP
jgi:hypothetical protein